MNRCVQMASWFGWGMFSFCALIVVLDAVVAIFGGRAVTQSTDAAMLVWLVFGSAGAVWGLRSCVVRNGHSRYLATVAFALLGLGALTPNATTPENHPHTNQAKDAPSSDPTRDARVDHHDETSTRNT